MIEATDNSSALPNGWVWTQLGDILEEVKKVQPREKPDKAFTYLDIASIDNDRHTVTRSKRYLGKDAPSRARQLVRSGDILFSTVRTYLRNIALVPDKYDGEIASTGFCVIRSSGGISGKYLLYLVEGDSFVNALSSIQRGTSYPAVRNSDVYERMVSLPPLSEQKRIVAKIEELFTRLDAGVGALKKVKAELKRYRQAVLKYAFEGKLTERWREKQQLDEWSSKEFFDFCVLRRGYDLPLKKAKQGPYPIVTSAGIAGYHNEFKAPGPGVTVGRSGSTGNVNYVEDDYWPHNTSLYVQDFKNSNPKYVYYFLKQFQLKKYSASTAVPTLNRNNLRGIYVKVPLIAEQQKIVDEIERHFSIADEVEQTIERSLKEADRLRQSILKRAFEGKLVPQNPHDEPAEKLLERIKAEKSKLRATLSGDKQRHVRKRYKKGENNELV